MGPHISSVKHAVNEVFSGGHGFKFCEGEGGRDTFLSKQQKLKSRRGEKDLLNISDKSFAAGNIPELYYLVLLNQRVCLDYYLPLKNGIYVSKILYYRMP